MSLPSREGAPALQGQGPEPKHWRSCWRTPEEEDARLSPGKHVTLGHFLHLSSVPTDPALGRQKHCLEVIKCQHTFLSLPEAGRRRGALGVNDYCRPQHWRSTACLLLVSSVREVNKTTPAICLSRAPRPESSERNGVKSSGFSSILPSPLLDSAHPLWSLWEQKALRACKQEPWDSWEAAWPHQIPWPIDISVATEFPHRSRRPWSDLGGLFPRCPALSCLSTLASSSSFWSPGTLFSLS